MNPASRRPAARRSTSALTAGDPAVAVGEVFHRRHFPEVHQFRYPSSMVWLDPGRPGDLDGRSVFFSSRRPAPVRFRVDDYGDGSGRPLDDQLAEVVADRGLTLPGGPIRMLTQPRRLGYVFNPITLYLCWDRPDEAPVLAVAEVTNTPWKQRTRYVVPLSADDGGSRDEDDDRDAGRADGDDPAVGGRFAKTLHVSPFLDEAQVYDLRVAGGAHDLDIRLDVYDDPSLDPRSLVIETRLRLRRRPFDTASLRRTLVADPLATLRVTAGIHLEAARLRMKGVPFVPHPRRRAAASTPRTDR